MSQVTSRTPLLITLFRQAASIVFVHGLQGHSRNTWTYYPDSSVRDSPSGSGDVKKPKGLSRILSIMLNRQRAARRVKMVFSGRRTCSRRTSPKARIMTFGYNTLVQNGLHTVNQGTFFLMRETFYMIWRLRGGRHRLAP